MPRASNTSPWNRAVPSRKEQRELKLEMLYETAARSFNERGFHATSLADLARQLGITKAALYHYVANKSDLLYRLHTLSLKAAYEAQDEARAQGRTGLEKVRLTVFHYVRRLTETRTACLVLFDADALNAEQAAEILAESRKVEHGLRDMVKEGIADGSIMPCDAKLATFVLVASMNWVSRWYDPKGEWTGEQVADGLSAYLARGLAHHPVAALPLDISAGFLTPVSEDEARDEAGGG